MDENKKQKIAFLFGAGCEGKGQLELLSGSDFKKDILLSKDVQKIFKFVNSDTTFTIKNEAILDARSSSVLYQTVKENPDFKFSSEDNETIFKNYAEYRNSNLKKSSEEIKTNFKNLYKAFLGKNDKNSKIQVSDDEKDLFFKNITLCAFSDELFNYLRFPKIYKPETAKVLKLYFSAYYSILKSLKSAAYGENEKNLVEFKNSSIVQNRKTIQEYVEKTENQIIKKYNNENQNIYYYAIKDLLPKKTAETTIITTNYTKFAEKITGFDTAYVHGRLDLFENILTKEVKSLKDFSNEWDCIFPFIFIPSGVKPIICEWQIEQYIKAIDAFKNADIFIILGYSINSDDEHIKNFLRERLKEKKVYLFKYMEKSDLQDFDNFQKKLHEDLHDSGNLIIVPFSDDTQLNYPTFKHELTQILTKEHTK